MITAAASSGKSALVWKWVNDRHPDFDPVYTRLLHHCSAAGDLVHEGPFDWEWRPPGFGELV